MQLWEEFLMERQEGIEEGLIHGKLKGEREILLALLNDIGEIPQELHDRIMLEDNSDTLMKWVKMAAHATSIQEFLNSENDSL